MSRWTGALASHAGSVAGALAVAGLFHPSAAQAAPTARAQAAPPTPDTIAVHGFPPCLAHTLYRTLAGARNSPCMPTSRIVDCLQSLPGVRSLRTRTISVPDRTYVQVTGRHGVAVRGGIEPRTLPGRPWEPGLRIRIDSAFRLGERVLARGWLARSGSSRNRRWRKPPRETNGVTAGPPVGEIALLLPLFYRGVESIGAQVAFVAPERGNDQMEESPGRHAPRYLVAARLASHPCEDAMTVELFADAGNGVRAGGTAGRDGSDYAALFGILIDERGRAGVRSFLAGRKRRNVITLEAVWSDAGAALTSPLSRSFWIVEQESTPLSFVKTEYQRLLFPGSFFEVQGRVEFVRTNRRGHVVPVLASTASVLGQRLTAEAAFHRGAVVALRWNAWPAGSHDLHRADRFLADMRALTGAGKSGSLRRW